MSGKFPNLSKGINLQMQEAKNTLYRMNPMKSIVGCSIIKFLKDKDK